jgi:hypothetical protein
MQRWLKNWSLRSLGLILLIGLLFRVDLHQLVRLMQHAEVLPVIMALLLLLPLITIKTLRWQALLRAQSVHIRIQPALLAYFGSLFIGLLTPGRLGEFVKAVHVRQECGTPLTYAISSVFTDRLFDLYLLLIVGGAALFALAPGNIELGALIGSFVVVTLPLILFLNDYTFGWVQRDWLSRWQGSHIGRPITWLIEVRSGMCMLSWPRLLSSSGLTMLAYGVFFGQCYLLARALDLDLSFIEVSYAVALGSLVTLIPISISGLGTREAAIIAYLGTLGISAEQALGFSLLVFLTFYLGSGLLGAVAWWIKPAPLTALHAAKDSI